MLMPIDIQKHILAYGGCDHLRSTDKSFQFDIKNDVIYNEETIHLYVPKQLAGFGTSVAYTYQLKPGKHEKKTLVMELLRKGFFGEDYAELVSDGWDRGCLLIRLERDGY